MFSALVEAASVLSLSAAVEPEAGETSAETVAVEEVVGDKVIFILFSVKKVWTVVAFTVPESLADTRASIASAAVAFWAALSVSSND